MSGSRIRTRQRQILPGIQCNPVSPTTKKRKHPEDGGSQDAEKAGAAIGEAPSEIAFPAARAGSFGLAAAVCVFLVLAVAIVFGQTLRHGFVNFDDDVYVYAAPRIVQGLTYRSVAWAFTHSHAGNWHPLTSISHMLDCQMYCLRPAGHHLTNLVLHAAAAVLLFLVLRSLTGELWLSAFVAAVFAVHPLRAESVAWVAERKAVLSGLFFMFTIAAYTWYARRRFSLARYVAVVMLFALGLMCKPSLVTLPFLLLLLDYWPLGRLDPPPAAENGLQPVGQLGRRILVRLVVEKLPLVALVIPICVTVLQMQRIGLQPLTVLSPTARVANALVSYVAYLGQLFYPVNLVAFYPHPGNALPIWKPVGAALVLLAISIAALVWRRAHPYLPIGWLWYLGTLVPVIGLVQVGQQQMADRYTYRSEIGISIALAWGIADLSRSWPWRRPVLACAAALVVASLMGITWRQTSYWRDSTTLWRHALNCNPRNYLAHLDLGNVAMECGRVDEAIRHYRKALEINPGYALAHCNLGQMLAMRIRRKKPYGISRRRWNWIQSLPTPIQSRERDGPTKTVGPAIAYYRKTWKSTPTSPWPKTIWGPPWPTWESSTRPLSITSRPWKSAPAMPIVTTTWAVPFIAGDESTTLLFSGVRLCRSDPAYAQAHFYLGQICLQQRKFDEAIDHFRKALSINPQLRIASQCLALALSQQSMSLPYRPRPSYP